MTGERMVVVVLLMVLVTFPMTVQAHDETKPETPTLTVTGNGQVAIAPDTAFVTFGMETAGKSLMEAQRLNNQVMQKVTARLGSCRLRRSASRHRPLPYRRNTNHRRNARRMCRPHHRRSSAIR